MSIGRGEPITSLRHPQKNVEVTNARHGCSPWRRSSALPSEVPTADDHDLRIARQVMEEGDLRHAAFHVACALNTAPQDADALALADALLRRSADPFSLAPLKADENFSGTVALRVRFLQQRGKHAEALPLIADILHATRNLGFLEWAAPRSWRWVPRWNCRRCCGS